jgi:Flp pilus assembly protein TadD/4-amino-4-deoxy-L-arabinose transferase-like glycosyltransferase
LSMEKYSRHLLGLILFLGILFEILYLIQFQDTPFAQLLMVDAKTFHLKALAILQGDWLGKSPSYQAPLYPYFLAFFYKLFSPNPLWIQIIQALVFSLTFLLLYFIGFMLFNRRVGIFSAALGVFYGVFIYYSGLLLKATLSVFFTGLFLLTLLRAQKFHNTLLFFLGGVLLGINMTLRENYVLVLPAILVWIVFLSYSDAGRPYRSGIKAAAVFSCGALLFLSPFLLKNYLLSGELIFTSYQGGANFYLGNNPASRGFYTRLPFVRANPEFEEQDFRAEAEKRSGRPLSPNQVSRFWFQRTLDHFREDPLLFPRLLLIKLYLFVNDYEVPDNYDFVFMKGLISTLKVGFLSFGMILPLALWGLFLSRKKSRDFILLYIFLGAYTLSVIVFYVNSRFRLPIVPALIPFAAFALSEGWRSFFSWNKKEKILSLTGLLFLGLLTFIPYADKGNFSFPHFKLGLEFEKKGNLDRAEQEYRLALEGQPDFAWAVHQLGVVLEKKGRLDEALTAYRRAFALQPDYGEALFDLAVLYEKKGDLSEAAIHYEKVLRVKPDTPEAHNNLGSIYEQIGRPEKAEQSYRKALQLRPAFVEPYNNLGVLYLKQGRLEQAREEFEKALKLYPNHPIVLKNIRPLL